jgi:YfiH family protein
MHAPDLDSLIPDWPAPTSVRALCSTRIGGSSSGRYSSLNLGLHVGDDVQAVEANRRRLQAAMGVRAVFLDQVHGSEMLEITSRTPDARRADGAFTSGTAVACTVMVADCLPVLLCNARGQSVAAAHAGWRGLLGVGGKGILEAAVATFGSPADELMAWLGPCIGPQAFEVGEEVRAAFVAMAPQAADCFMPRSPGKWLANLQGLARQRLAAAGVESIFGNDGSAGWCTAGNPSRYFSHRRDGVSGRMAVSIWRTD